MSKLYRGSKLRIYPTEEQKITIDRYIEVFREIYNWGINKEEELRQLQKQGKVKYGFCSFRSLRKMYRKERKENPNSIWNDMPSTSGSLALQNVETAYKKFFKKLTRYPKLKKKTTSKSYYSFNTRYDRFNIDGVSIKIEGIPTRISLGFDSKIYSSDENIKITNPTIIRNKLNEYYVSFNLLVDSEDLDIPKSKGIGIDLGCRQTFALSTGEVFNQPKEILNKLERKRIKQQRHVTRDINRRLNEATHTKTKYEDIPESKRAIKRRHKLNKTYRKIHNIKDTFYHNVTKQIVDRNPEFVCMETFKVREIQRTEPYMNDKICTVSFYDITRKLKYKCEKYNIPFIQAPTEFASTKTCSNCGHKKKMKGKHIYKCPVCGMKMDRDINAAINLKNYGLDHLYSYIEK